MRKTFGFPLLDRWQIATLPGITVLWFTEPLCQAVQLVDTVFITVLIILNNKSYLAITVSINQDKVNDSCQRLHIRGTSNRVVLNPRFGGIRINISYKIYPRGCFYLFWFKLWHRLLVDSLGYSSHVVPGCFTGLGKGSIGPVLVRSS